MDDSRFWMLVDAARAQAGANAQARAPALRAALAALPADEIQGFQRVYDRMIARAKRWDLWSAARLMNGGCSGDGFRAFRDWLISEGKVTYEQALADPDSLAELPVRDGFELASFGYAAMDAYAEHTDRPLERDESDALALPEGHEWSEDELAGKLPSLADKYAN